MGKRQTLSIEQLPRPTFGDTGSTMSVFFLFGFLIFSPVNAVLKQTPVLSFYTTQRAYKEISINCLSQGHNDVMPNTGIQPANLRSLARQSVKFCLFFANFDSPPPPFKFFSGYAPDWARIQ